MGDALPVGPDRGQVLEREAAGVGVHGSDLDHAAFERGSQQAGGEGLRGRQDVAECVGKEVVPVLPVDRVHQQQVERWLVAGDEDLQRIAGIDDSAVGRVAREKRAITQSAPVPRMPVYPPRASGADRQAHACLDAEGVDQLAAASLEFVAVGGERFGREVLVEQAKDVEQSGRSQCR